MDVLSKQKELHWISVMLLTPVHFYHAGYLYDLTTSLSLNHRLAGVVHMLKPINTLVLSDLLELSNT